MILVKDNNPQLARERAQEWARFIINNPNVIYLDVETNDLPDKEGNFDKVEVIQLGISDNYDNTLLDVLIRPKKPMSPEATKVHGISWDQVRSSQISFGDLLPIVYKTLADRHVVCYNADFDITSIIAEFSRIGYVLPEFNYSCAMLYYAQFCGIWNKRKQDWKWHKQPNLIGLNAHTAVDDSRLTRAVVRWMAEFNEEENDLELNF